MFPVVAPAPVAMQGLWVVATNNKEDVVLTRVPWEKLRTCTSNPHHDLSFREVSERLLVVIVSALED